MESSASSSRAANSGGAETSAAWLGDGFGEDEVERRRWRDLLDPLARFDDLDRAGARMGLDPTPLRPGVGRVVVVDIGDENTVVRLVHDQPDVAIDARRPEMRVLAVVDAMQLETVAGGVHLQVEDARLHGLLIEAGQPVERSREGVCDEEGHGLTPRTPSSPRRRSG